VIIGGAFGKIVDSLVGDLIMPVIGAITGGLDFSNYFVALAGQKETGLEAARKAGAVLAWGNFVTILVNFVILAFIIFLMVRQIAKLKKPEEAAAAEAPAEAPAPVPMAGDPTTLQLLREIRDELRTRH
jgi:large conductance mechanosensitive channel